MTPPRDYLKPHKSEEWGKRFVADGPGEIRIVSQWPVATKVTPPKKSVVVVKGR
jgi:hypothetical protein